MRIYQGLPNQARLSECELSIGNFDGVHRGHQVLIQRLVAAARPHNRLAGIMTFDPHPIRVLHPEVRVAYLTTLDERLALLEALGLDFVVVCPFTSVTARTPAAAFMDELVRHLHPRRLWVGADFALGHHREGDVPALRRLGNQMGFTVEVIEPVQVEGIEVRSGHIRQALAEGKVEQAAQMLGRPYGLAGEVAHRGRKIGLPTINLSVSAERMIPGRGVYATWCHVAGKRLPAATNIGIRPTFTLTSTGDSGTPSVEAHLPGFEGDLYGAQVRLDFILRLREEQQFPDAEALMAQIRQDVIRTRQALTPEMPRFEEIEHTADWGVRVFGRDFVDLLAQAGAAMFALQAVDMTKEPQVWREIEVEAPDQEVLLVTWLNELLYQSDTRDESYTRFVVDEATETTLRARAGGIPGRGARAHIKAVTYHGLKVRETADGWMATVVFDT